jgi:hypothetical protein
MTRPPSDFSAKVVFNPELSGDAFGFISLERSYLRDAFSLDCLAQRESGSFKWTVL